MTTPRAGKYCPRCQTMTFVDREVCENCGHHFRTGLTSPALDEKLDESAKHRTMQFTLPPVAARVPPKTETKPDTEEKSQEEGTPQETGARPQLFQPLHRRVGLALALAVAVLAALTVAGALALGWHKRAPTVSESALSPVGVWETTLTSRSAANAHLTFQFAGNGAGMFSWQEQGGGGTNAAGGQSPLRWQRDANGLLALSITPPPAGDAVSGTIVAIFNSHPWLWRVDHPHKQMMLGNLALTEK